MEKPTSVVLHEGSLRWTDQRTGSQQSVPTDQLVAILPQSAQPTGSHHTASTLEDSGSSTNTAAALTALYLERDQAEGRDGSHDVQLKSLTIPEDVLNEPSNAEELQRYLLPQIPAHLRPTVGSSDEGDESRRDLHVVVSTLSGTQGALPFFKKALKPLVDAVVCGGPSAYHVHKTQSARTITELCDRIFVPRARAGVEQTVIVLSGDGGVVDVVRSFSDIPLDQNDDDDGDSPSAALFVPPTLCVIPTGTGNATANSAGLVWDGTLGLSSLLRGTPRVLPTFKVRVPRDAVSLADEGRRREPVSQHTTATAAGMHDFSSPTATIYGAVVMSWGMHASLVADSDTTEYRKFGVDRFKMAAKELLWPADGSETHRYKGKVSLVASSGDSKGQTVEIDRAEHMYVLTTPVSQLEKGFTVSPSSKPLDGQLRIVHFGPLAAERAMEIMGLAYQGGKHVAEREVEYEAVEKVGIEFREDDERWRRVCVDGTIVAVPEGGRVEVERERRELVKLVAP